MFTGAIISILTVLLIVFFLVYKKQMINKIFALNMSAPANDFTQQLEQTADLIIKRLENEAVQLELLLAEAETKIGMLNRQIEHANKIIERLSKLQVDSRAVDKEPVNIEKHRLIIAMAEQGYGVTEMAKLTGVGKGEIMLLLQLNKK